jgi:hypothetical protein
LAEFRAAGPQRAPALSWHRSAGGITAICTVLFLLLLAAVLYLNVAKARAPRPAAAATQPVSARPAGEASGAPAP